MKYIVTRKKRVLEVRVNDDGTLFITEDGVNSIHRPGSFVMSFGSIERVLSRCVESDLSLPEYRRQVHYVLRQDREQRKERKKEREATRAEREAERDRQRKEAFEQLLTDNNGVIPTTFDNIGVVLRYLNTMNWGGWELPKMTVGYRCNQFDCDGKMASTMTLDEPIDIVPMDERDEGYLPQMVSRFQVGAPRGYLLKYHRC